MLERFDPTELTERARRVDSEGLTFGVSGEQRPFPVDPIPRVIPAHEWSVLAAGLTQRARALEAYLRDVADRHDIKRLVRFSTELTGAE